MIENSKLIATSVVFLADAETVKQITIIKESEKKQGDLLDKANKDNSLFFDKATEAKRLDWIADSDNAYNAIEKIHPHYDVQLVIGTVQFIIDNNMLL